jgi:hypothetical protein
MPKTPFFLEMKRPLRRLFISGTEGHYPFSNFRAAHTLQLSKFPFSVSALKNSQVIKKQ